MNKWWLLLTAVWLAGCGAFGKSGGGDPGVQPAPLPESRKVLDIERRWTFDVGSGIEKLGTKARMYLERVVREHPETPWAKIAARELETNVGWKWVEKGPN